MASTAVLPSLSHFSLAEYSFIYEPSDDTFLLCDALQRDRHLILSKDPCITLEVGSGSGCVITFLTRMLIRDDIFVQSFATDLNPYAVIATARTATANHVQVDPIQCNLANGLSCDRIGHNVDVLVFNPPYVPTPPEEVAGTGIEASWAGGEDGRQVIDLFLPLIEELLSPSGLCYMVLVEENRPQDVMDRLNASGALTSEIVLRRRAINEGLMVLRCCRKG